jgi:hypothetical protein
MGPDKMSTGPWHMLLEIEMNNSAELEMARRDGTIKQRLRDLVGRQRDDDYARRQLALLSPHLTKEEKNYCQQCERQFDW